MCIFCKKTGHMQKDCAGFKKWLVKKGNDTISCVDESLYADFPPNTWWIDLGATVHITNSLQGLHSVRTIRRGERSLKVANGKEMDVKAIGVAPLALGGGYILLLNNVLYAPSSRRNLISVSALDDEHYFCKFGNHQCVIEFNHNNVGLAIRHDKLYMLLLNDSSVMNVCDGTNKHKKSKGDETSSKLWHYRLCHISKGRIERLIREEILHPLDFSDSDCFIDCIKGTYIQHKKGAIRST